MNGFIYVIQKYCYFIAYLLKTELTYQGETQEALHFILFTFSHKTCFPLSERILKVFIQTSAGQCPKCVLQPWAISNLLYHVLICLILTTKLCVMLCESPPEGINSKLTGLEQQVKFRGNTWLHKIQETKKCSSWEQSLFIKVESKALEFNFLIELPENMEELYSLVYKH